MGLLHSHCCVETKVPVHAQCCKRQVGAIDVAEYDALQHIEDIKEFHQLLLLIEFIWPAHN
jgi:hypothetical protein